METDIQSEKIEILTLLGYIFPCLFFLPLLFGKGDESLVKFHANQQLILLIFLLIGFLVAYLTLYILIGLFLIPLLFLAHLVFAVLGIKNVLKRESKPLPLIGGLK